MDKEKKDRLIYDWRYALVLGIMTGILIGIGLLSLSLGLR